MGTINEEFVKKTKDYISNLLENSLSKDFHYHNSRHTLDVLNYAEIIGTHSRLDETDMNLLRLSALFHDTGYIDQYMGHEEKSAAFATDYLQSKGINDSDIDQVVRAILATKMPQQPLDTVSEILCDADLMYLADQFNYFTEAELLRKEWSGLNVNKLSEYEFLSLTLDFFDNHHYFTRYGKEILQKKKELNKELIREKVESHNQVS